jgi:HEPN domain-containing protein
MNRLLNKFPQQHLQLIPLILKVVAAEKIFLLGLSTTEQRTDTIFQKPTESMPTRSFVSHYYILVLVTKNEKNSSNNLQDNIESHCRSFAPVTAIIVTIEEFNEWLAKGHPFACKVVSMNQCIHDTENILLATSVELDVQDLTKINEAYYKTGINKVQEFLAGSDLFRIREQNKMAAFMLHQATEHALHTLLKITTGLYMNTHSIDKLVRYCSMVSYKLPDLFNRNNDKNERLFQLLQKAYIESRYKEDYSIKMEDLLSITERVRVLESIVKDVYNSLLP